MAGKFSGLARQNSHRVSSVPEHNKEFLLKEPINTCEISSAKVPGYEIINSGNMESGYRRMCTSCFNTYMADRLGFEDFDNSRIDPIRLVDSAGQEHEFHFTTHLFGDKLALNAFEMKEGVRDGYEFQLIGDPEEERFKLLGLLMQKIRRALVSKHIQLDPNFGWQVVDQCVRGRIDSDPDQPERKPMLIIDGQNISWEEFGRMLMTFEGWQFRLNLLDRSEED